MLNWLRMVYKFLFVDDTVFFEEKRIVEEFKEPQEKSIIKNLEEPLKINTIITKQNYYEISDSFNNNYNTFPLEQEEFKGSLAVGDILYDSSVNSNRLYLYNISSIDHSKYHPIFKDVSIPACPKDKEYILAFSIPELIILNNKNPQFTNFILENGRRVMTDMVNPDCIGINQFGDKSLKHLQNYGNNLGERGVFWSENNPPTESELKIAKEKLSGYYKNLLERINIVISSSDLFRDKLQRYKDRGYPLYEALKAVDSDLHITPEHHAAADYLGVTTTWHPFRK